MSRAIIRDKYPRGLAKWYEYQQLNHTIRYNLPKIVFPNISDGSNFTIDDGYLTDMTAFVIPSTDLYLLSLLNSQLLFHVISTLAVNRRGGYVEWKVQYVEQLPIRNINFATPAARRAELAEKGRKLYERSLSERSYEYILGFVDHHLKQEPEESDVVHDLLAFLAEQMIELNKHKQAEQQRFLDWLETALKIRPDRQGNTGLDALTNKTKVRGYLGDYQKNEGILSIIAGEDGDATTAPS